MKLFTKQGITKSQTECAPNNGYFLIPLYDKVSTARVHHVKCIRPPNWGLLSCASVLHVYRHVPL